MSAKQIVYLNGDFLPIEEARVPVLDRGFIFGDGVYEVVPVYGGRPFRWAQHLARLERSLDKVGIANPLDTAGWTTLVDMLVARHPWPDQFVYMQVTSEFPPVAPALLASGVSAISLPDERWLHCDIKSTSLLGNVMARQKAVEAGAAECVMFRDGFLTEGSASNIWVVRKGTVFGPPRDNLVLEGIRYGLMGELCDRAGLPMELRRIVHAEVLAADELLLTSATKEVLAITELDGKPVGSGKPGPIWKRLHEAYQQAKAA